MDSTVQSVGHCELAELRKGQGALQWADHRLLRTRALTWGAVGSSVLFGLYLGLVGWANSFQHAFVEFLRLWYWMAPLIVGFGIQVGLYLYARGAARSAGHPNASGIMASGGASTVSMAACCVHHLADVLPVIGLAGTGLFLSTYQALFLLVGVVSNAMGILYLLSIIGRHRLAPSRGSILSLLPTQTWRPVFITGGLASAITLGFGVWGYVF